MSLIRKLIHPAALAAFEANPDLHEDIRAAADVLKSPSRPSHERANARDFLAQFNAVNPHDSFMLMADLVKLKAEEEAEKRRG